MAAPAKTYYFTSPRGAIVKVTNLLRFCRKKHLSHSSMRKVVAGLQDNHLGWSKALEQ
ncbi:hypothetical protein VPHD472_0091 [Vibrio phage D472]